MNEEEKNEDYQIEEEQKECVPKITAIESKDTVNDWLTDFGADLAKNILAKMQGEYVDYGENEDLHRGAAALECVRYSEQLDNSLCVGGISSGIVILDSTWLNELREFLGVCVKVPDSFGQDKMQELMQLLVCLEFHDLALMQVDIRDKIVDLLEDLSVSINVELAEEGE